VPQPSLFAALTLAGSLAVAGPGLAQDETAQENATPAARIVNGQAFGDWTVQCEALAVNETACVLSQRLVRGSDGAFLAELLAFSASAGSQRYLAARVPVGVHLPSGFAVRPADAGTDAQQTEFVWQSCSRELCEALLALTDEALGMLEEAETLVGGYRPSLRADPLVFRFSVAGLDEGLSALEAASAAAR
jgi:invasion protein IalB